MQSLHCALIVIFAKLMWLSLAVGHIQFAQALSLLMHSPLAAYVWVTLELPLTLPFAKLCTRDERPERNALQDLVKCKSCQQAADLRWHITHKLNNSQP